MSMASVMGELVVGTAAGTGAGATAAVEEALGVISNELYSVRAGL
jgi:hypothetical protein